RLGLSVRQLVHRDAVLLGEEERALAHAPTDGLVEPRDDRAAEFATRGEVENGDDGAARDIDLAGVDGEHRLLVTRLELAEPQVARALLGRAADHPGARAF